MSTYRIYPISKDNHIAGPATLVTCESDDDAVAKARESSNGRDAELWEGTRRIGQVKTQGAAWETGRP